MGTAIEGEWEEVMSIVSRCFKELKKDCRRIYISVKVDYREGGSDRIVSKVKSVDNSI